jgi:membrane protease YdiL (CAAX protease family)
MPCPACLANFSTGESPPSPHPWDPPRTLAITWAKAIGGLALASLASRLEPSGVVRANLAGVAAFLFIVLADGRVRARGATWGDHGVPRFSLRERSTWVAYARGVGAGLLSCAVVLPCFALLFAGYAWLLPRLSPELAGAITPYHWPGHLAIRLPPGFALQIVLQLLVVAIPEELFYRGWVQTSWARAAPERGLRFLGARLGAGFLWTQLLFAAGHLVVLQPWRLATFFPGLWFGWLRERHGNVVAPAVAHALSNLCIMVLEASFYGG